MLPTAIIVGLIIGRLWAVPLAVVLVLAIYVIDGGASDEWLAGAGIAAVNALVGVAVHQVVRGAVARVSRRAPAP